MAAGGPQEGHTKLRPIARRTMQYTVSEKEYALLHKRLFKRLPSRLREKLPSPLVYTNSLKDVPDFNAATVRASVRLFWAVQSALKLYEFVVGTVLRRNRGPRYELVMRLLFDRLNR